MARHGENIRKRKDGRWEGRYRIYSAEKGHQLYRSVYGTSYKVVKEKLAEKKIESQEKENRSGEGKRIWSVLCFSDMAEQWLKEVMEKKKCSTYVKYRFIYQKHLKSGFQNKNMAAMVEAVDQKTAFSSLSDSIRKSIYCVLNQILKFASRMYNVDPPALARPSFHTPKKQVEVFSKKEQARLFSVLYQEMDRYKLAILLCMHTGLRLGELCALKWEDFDVENHLLTVNRTAQRLYVNGHSAKTMLMETAPKSEHSRREIPLPSAIVKLLFQFKGEKPYIFGGNKALEPRTLQNHFKKILQKAGSANKNFHVLRHTFSTNCIEGGMDVKSLSELLGHSDVQITLNRYVHPSMDTKRSYMDGLSAFYGQIYGQIHG